jgi:hypothetical protein
MGSDALMLALHVQGADFRNKDSFIARSIAEHSNECQPTVDASGRIAQVVERPPLDREVRGSNPSHDTMALLLGQHYEFPQCGIIKGKLLL